jgi:tartrate-resistant acid phosphatase type 5
MKMHTRFGLAAAAVLTLAACSEDDPVTEPAPTGPPAEGGLRFVALGDTGTGEAGQLEVADAMKAKCDADGCAFAVLLGDNIYETGPTSTDDPQWEEKFEIPYAALDMPFYAVLGNHDYGDSDGSSGNMWPQGPVEVDYSGQSDKWTMPATYYTFTETSEADVGFVTLDTNSLLWDDTSNGDQRSWYADAVAALGTSWTVALGHHPYISNGIHGNAGEYGAFDPNPGESLKAFFDETVCGTVDVYLCGHDHHLEWPKEQLCGAELLLSGAGSEYRLVLGDNEDHFSATELGFLYVVIEGDTFWGQFIDAEGAVLFERSFTRPSL